MRLPVIFASSLEGRVRMGNRGAGGEGMAAEDLVAEEKLIRKDQLSEC
jgi:hypothetical protein